MNASFRYELDRTPKKFNCPSCGKRRFVRYINLETKGYLSEEFGRCDREENCGYWMKPGKECVPFHQINRESMKRKTRVHIPQDIFKMSRQGYDRNSFVQYLLTLAGPEMVSHAIKQYHIGTCKAGNIFWFIDACGNVRYGQIKQFDAAGHTIKDSITAVHAILKSQAWAKEYGEQENKISCLYGAHLLHQHPQMPVALCESPKTAIIGSLYFPEMLWLAAGAKSYLTEDRTRVLQRRDVTLFPDLGAYTEWKAYADAHGWKTSYYLEEIATDEERTRQLDLADFIVRGSVHVQSCTKETSEHEHQEPYFEALLDSRTIEMHPAGYPADWSLTA